MAACLELADIDFEDYYLVHRARLVNFEMYRGMAYVLMYV